MERCQDSSCGFENRQEYCQERARDPGGDALVVLAAIEGLLYETRRASSDRFVMQNNRDGQRVERSFSVLCSGQGGWLWPLTETQVEITHDTQNAQQRQAYTVAVAWSVHRPESRGLIHKSIFTIDTYPAGPVRSMVEHLDFVENKRDCRPITGYDYEQLYDVLALVADAHCAERADDARAVA